MESQIQFSERERQVNELLAQGKSNKQIALALGVSVRAVEFHLSNIYAKLGVNSRTEAALKLAETDLRESTGADLRESTVVEMGKPADNGGASISTRRIPMKNFAYIVGGLFVTTLIVLLAVFNLPLGSKTVTITNPISMPTATFAIPTETPTPIVSTKERVIEQIRQLVAEYDQAVQAEKKNGNVEFSKDPTTGEDIFLFKDESFARILGLNEKLWENINRLNALYVQVYRDELKPTPFPTQSSTEESKAYYDSLVRQSENYCAGLSNIELNVAAILVYRPDDGKYLPFGIGDEYARCTTYGQMIEEWRTAPMLAKVNKDIDTALIRQIMGKPDLKLTFQSIADIANAPGRGAALYTDETGAKYYVDIETSRLASIEPNFPSHPDIPTADVKSMDELRGVAKQFAMTNSPRLAELESALLYEENCKGNICFFRWDYRNKDWSGTDWAMMPPFLQVGALTNGQIVAYNNTLDLFK
ncbi:MAG: response regulator transcription factor [Chloroflexi bacterium]|nr:response regulator transcription factor [Chloroflexota bacterium]